MLFKNNIHWDGTWNFKHVDRQGAVIDEWSEKNALINSGEYKMLDVYFRGATAPSEHWLRLTAGLSETATMAAVTASEASGSGYAPQLITSNATYWPTLALSSGDYQVNSTTVTFEATGGSWGPVDEVALCTASNSNEGSLVAYVALSTSRTLVSGDSLQVSVNVKLQ